MVAVEDRIWPSAPRVDFASVGPETLYETTFGNQQSFPPLNVTDDARFWMLRTFKVISAGVGTVLMPKGADVLGVEYVTGALKIVALVDPREDAYESRWFETINVGGEMTPESWFVGSYADVYGGVRAVFERLDLFEQENA